MNHAQQFAMSRFATRQDREAAINARIDKIAKKRDYAADAMGNAILSWSYQQEIDQLVELLTPNEQGQQGDGGFIAGDSAAP